MFFHQMFEAIAAANGAYVEHSSSVGAEDSLALPTTYLESLETYEPTENRINLDPRIVGALGRLDGQTYRDSVKARAAGAVAAGMVSLRASRKELTGQVDLEPLERAFELLSRTVGQHGAANETPIGKALRTFAWPTAGAVFGELVAIAMSVDEPALKVAAAAAGALAGPVADRIYDDVKGAGATYLLKRSFVRQASLELGADQPRG